MSDEKRTGIERIAAERARQLAKLGWTPEHDAHHDDGSLAVAAACYAASAARLRIYERQDYAPAVHFADPWPWEQRSDARPYGRLRTPEELAASKYAKPGERMGSNVLADDVTDAEAIRLLEKAGALIAAEIDRLLTTPAEPADAHD